MSKIESLTPEQEIELIKVRDEWLAIGRNTDPLNREAAESSITNIYAAIGKDKPKFMMFQSPWQAAAAIYIMKMHIPELEKILRNNLWNKLEDNLWNNLRNNLEDNLWNNLWNKLWNKLEDNLGDTLRNNLRNNLWNNLRNNLRDNLENNLRNNLGNNLWDNLRNNLRNNLEDNLGNNLRKNLENNLGNNLENNLENNLGDNLWKNLRDNLRNNLDTSYFAGQHWCAWEVFYDFCNKIGVPYVEADRVKLDLWLEQSKTCHWWWPKDGLCIMSDRHTILTVDDRGRLHNETGPACAYADGYAIYAIHGVVVPANIILEPILMEQIESETNTEVRRVMMERYGYEKYMQDCNAIIVDSCDENHPIIGLRTAKLLRKDIMDDEPIIYIDVLNSTPEEDGSVKRYMLRVDPNAYNGEAAKNCHAALASTFRNDLDSQELTYKDYKDYQPVFES